MAGNGAQGYGGYSGDGGPATSAEILPNGLAFDIAGNLYISGGSAVREVSAETGVIRTVAGSGYSGIDSEYPGDSSSATVAQLCGANGIAFDAAGDLLIADGCNHRVRKVTLPGTIPQTITFPAITGTEYATTTMPLSATASSGLTVAFASSTPTVCTALPAPAPPRCSSTEPAPFWPPKLAMSSTPLRRQSAAASPYRRLSQQERGRAGRAPPLPIGPRRPILSLSFRLLGSPRQSC